MPEFQLHTDFQPSGDQPQAIEKLVEGVDAGLRHQVLLGVTGSGKTFSVANVIQQVKKPVLVISHNKTLAAQLYQEYRDFFPKNAVEYFVSYYDFYQPEAYIPQTDTYIEKDADINEDIERMRLSATTSLLTRNDVIVVASVSCIYNLGSPVEYSKQNLRLKEGMKLRREDLIKRLLDLYYLRNDYEFKRGTFRVKGDQIDLYPSYIEVGIRFELLGDQLKSIELFDPFTGKRVGPVREGAEIERKGSMYKDLSQDELSRMYDLIQYGELNLFPAKHYVAAEELRKQAIEQIKHDLQLRLAELKNQGKTVAAYRLEQKTNYDLELMESLGYTKGIENYSRYFDGRKPGEAPYSLLDYFALAQEQTGGDFLVIVDESHMTIPQVRGMYNGDKARKETLIDYGFRLPSALDNRPLQFHEFLERVPQVIYTSATPNEWEIQESLKSARDVWHFALSTEHPVQIGHKGIVEQLIRPTGILDPEIEIRGSQGQIDNLLEEIKQRVSKGERVLVTTLTKRMAEDLAEFLQTQGIKVQYLHADILTLDRSDILENLRMGVYDVVVGINLLREGLDLPEVSLVAILEADKEGFLRSETSLVQTMGRAARHMEGRVIMYADTVTGSMKRAIDEINRRREVQVKYNEEHSITPQSITKPIREKLIERTKKEEKGKVRYEREFQDILTLADSPSGALAKDGAYSLSATKSKEKLILQIEKEMKNAAKNLDFEKAAFLRDRIHEIQEK